MTAGAVQNTAGGICSLAEKYKASPEVLRPAYSPRTAQPAASTPEPLTPKESPGPPVTQRQKQRCCLSTSSSGNWKNKRPGCVQDGRIVILRLTYRSATGSADSKSPEELVNCSRNEDTRAGPEAAPEEEKTAISEGKEGYALCQARLYDTRCPNVASREAVHTLIAKRTCQALSFTIASGPPMGRLRASLAPPIARS